jgi:SAM-dependent methyltransferase
VTLRSAERGKSRYNPLVSSDTAVFYGPEYHDNYACSAGLSHEDWLRYFGGLAEQIVLRLDPKTVLDVGCAKGLLVECLRDRGIEAYGLDISEYAISKARPDVRPYCWVASAADAIADEYDLIVCTEVCEHLPEAEANEAVRQMTSHSKMILFSSTPGCFEDPTHINLHPEIDWLRLFARFSFAPDDNVSIPFLPAWAMLLRKVEGPICDRELCQFAYKRQQAPQRELDTILNSKGWKLLNRYRNFRNHVNKLLKVVAHIRNR